ncbi:MAG: acetylxylan esterase [Candidatus Hydrogenedentes bacterium]|nr:acetylxylan esterase [Candidatus Hydrogenedentota bacterium]
MLTTAFAMICLSAIQGATLWLSPADWRQTPPVIAQADSYEVWVWAPKAEGGALVLGGSSLPLTPDEKAKSPYLWMHLEKTALPAAPLQITAPAGVAALVLSTEPGFHPELAASNRFVMNAPERVADRRAETARHTDTVFTMPHFASRAEWEVQADTIRRRIQISSGLMPLPARTPLKAEVFDKIAHEDYTIEKVHFEAWPGFLVTGNLYRPIGEGPFPGVIMPHGHWKEGRMENTDLCCVAARGITLARMGMVAFSYDMIGYVDSFQCKHAWGKEREKLWGVHPFALQLWSSVRAIDFIQGLPGVDVKRIGCTGASGGGTQTFAVTAIDPRVKVSAPVNMISCSMQGGCVCENAPIIRMANSNLEIGALAAPRPLMMVSATGDWTRETPRVEYPAIRSIYALYGAEDKIEQHQVDESHNYNKESREAVYRFLGKHLLAQDGWDAFTEPAWTMEAPEALRVFRDAQIETLRTQYPDQDTVIQSVIDATAAKWEAVLPKTLHEAAGFRSKYGTVIADTLGLIVPGVNDLQSERTGKAALETHYVERWIIREPQSGAAIPALFYRPLNNEVVGAVVLVHGEGKAALANPVTDAPGDLVLGLLAQNKAVMAIDAFLTGEHHSPFARTTRYTEGGFMDTFQPTDTGYRVQDILTAVSFLKSRRDLNGAIDVVGLGDAGLWAVFAAGADPRIERTVADLNGFNRLDDAQWVEKAYVPCIRSVGDVNTAAALTVPRKLVIANRSPEDTTPYLGATLHPGPLDGVAVLGYLQ